MRRNTLAITGCILFVSVGLFHALSGPSVANLKPLASKIGINVSTALAADAAARHNASIEWYRNPKNPYLDARAKHQEKPTQIHLVQAKETPKVVTPKPRPQASLLPVVDQPDIKMKHKLIANEILMTLVPQCRDTLKNFYVRYDNPEHRGLAGKSIMILDGGVPDEEFRALFVHELGHVIDLGCLRGNQEAGLSVFTDGHDVMYNDDPSLQYYSINWITASTQRSTSEPEDFASGYASSDIFEDFAEAFAYFVLHNDAFAIRATENVAMSKKYAFFRDYLFNGQIPDVATGNHPWNGRVVWDITKLDYEWHNYNDEHIAKQ